MVENKESGNERSITFPPSLLAPLFTFDRENGTGFFTLFKYVRSILILCLQVNKSIKKNLRILKLKENFFYFKAIRYIYVDLKYHALSLEVTNIISYFIFQNI